MLLQTKEEIIKMAREEKDTYFQSNNHKTLHWLLKIIIIIIIIMIIK